MSECRIYVKNYNKSEDFVDFSSKDFIVNFILVYGNVNKSENKAHLHNKSKGLNSKH